jgi:hypothetical protein
VKARVLREGDCIYSAWFGRLLMFCCNGERGIDQQEYFDLYSRMMKCSRLIVLYKHVSKFEIGEQVMVKDESVTRGNLKLESFTYGRMKLFQLKNLN